MQTKFTDANDAIVERLRALARERPDLKDAARFYEAVLPLLNDADLRVVPVSLTRDEAREKLGKGNPVLPGLDLDLDDQAVRRLMLDLAGSMETNGGMHEPCRLDMDKARLSTGAGEEADTVQPDAARLIRLALEGNKLDLGMLLPHVAAGDRGFVETVARDLDLGPDLLWVLAQNALKPALHAWRRQLAGLFDGDIPWDKGYCFVCGADATLGELRENGQILHLRCGQCGADWQSGRLRCVFCGNEDHGTLSCLYSEDQRERARVEACDKCRCYLKVIASFSPTPPEMLAVEDLATLHLDYIALERGYEKRRNDTMSVRITLP